MTPEQEKLDESIGEVIYLSAHLKFADFRDDLLAVCNAARSTLPKTKKVTVYTMRSFIGDSRMHYSNEWTSESELFAHISLCLKNGHRVEVDPPIERMVPA